MNNLTYGLSIQRLQEHEVRYVVRAYPNDNSETLSKDFENWEAFEEVLGRCMERYKTDLLMSPEQLSDLRAKVDSASYGVPVFRDDLALRKDDTFCILCRKQQEISPA